MAKEDSALDKILYNEYHVYLNFVKWSEENRDKYIRLYLSLITGVVGFSSYAYLYVGEKPVFFKILLVANITVLIISFVICYIILSARKGNVKCRKRINMIRGYFKEKANNGAVNLDLLFLPTSGREPKYFEAFSVEGILLFSLSFIMSVNIVLILLSICKLSAGIDNCTLYIILPLLTVLLFFSIFCYFKCSLKDEENRDLEKLGT